jgi:hypothetical protein
MILDGRIATMLRLDRGYLCLIELLHQLLHRILRFFARHLARLRVSVTACHR